jgi:hypothetical protein
MVCIEKLLTEGWEWIRKSESWDDIQVACRRFQDGSSKSDARALVLRIAIWVDMYKYHGQPKSI